MIRPDWRPGGWSRRLALALSGGALMGLSMPGLGPGSLAYIALVPLLLAIHGAPPRQAFLLGLAGGFLSFAISMSWVAETIHTFGGLPWLLAEPVCWLLAAWMGLFVALFTAGTRLIDAHTRIPLAIAAPPLWVVLEYLRAHLLTGLPWNLLGLAAHEQVRMIQIADVGGIYAVSWYVATVGACLYALLLPLFDTTRGYRQAHYFNHGLVLFLLPVCVAAYGQVRIAALSLHHQQNPDPAGPIRVALVQPNIPQEVKWNPEALDGIMQRLARQTTQAALLEPDLIVWPEASAPLVLDYSPRYQNMVRQLAVGAGTHLLVGSLSPVLERLNPATRNSAYLFGPNGRLVDLAAKEHLVPFGEYVPLERLLPFVRRLTQGIGDLVPGSGGAVLEHPRGSAGLAVCYELIFPDLVRRRFADGADFLVTITNDAWFGTSAAPAQHFANGVFRAVENRAYVVRAANTGISGMVDPYGIVQARSELNTEAVVAASIHHRADTSFYTRHGDRFAWLCVLLSAAALLRAAARARQRAPRPAKADHGDDGDEADD